MQLLFATNYSLLNALVKVVQAYVVTKEYAIVKSRSKAKYKFNLIVKVDIIYERNNKLQHKFKTK